MLSSWKPREQVREGWLAEGPILPGLAAGTLPPDRAVLAGTWGRQGPGHVGFTVPQPGLLEADPTSLTSLVSVSPCALKI